MKTLPEIDKLLPADEQFLKLIKERDTKKEILLTSILLSLSKEITSCRTRNEFLDVVKQKLYKVFPYKEMVISLLNEDGQTHSAFLYNLTEESQNHPDYHERALEKYILEDGIYPEVLKSDRPVIFELEEVMRREYFPPYVDFFYQNGIRQGVAIPLQVNNESIGAVFIWLEDIYAYSDFHLNLAVGICSQISVSVANIRAYEKIERQLAEINRYKSQLEQENQYLQEQIQIVYNHDEMVGKSLAIKDIARLVSMVAYTDSTVLILGETGTGKELVARAVHNLSPRKSKLIIKINCASLPPSLIESELFGHERGSFTGAFERRVGKFELADKGTIFLDEIGELDLELQGKLLRVIQEREFERLGGKQTIKVDVRIIAATNRDLLKEVEAGKFRADLYYRLNVFPIVVPPLRDRAEDIPLLVMHFIKKLSGKLNRKIASVSEDCIKRLMTYQWPGNIRELEHQIERSMLMATGPVITEVFLPKDNAGDQMKSVKEPLLKSLEQNEREHILAVLNNCNWRISGAGQAAEILGLPATTLHSRMKKLGIKKEPTCRNCYPKVL